MRHSATGSLAGGRHACTHFVLRQQTGVIGEARDAGAGSLSASFAGGCPACACFALRGETGAAREARGSERSRAVGDLCGWRG